MARARYRNRIIFDSSGRLPSLPPDKRLGGAMRAVDHALTEQKAELAAFRAKMAELKGAMKDMRESIEDYADNVERIDIDGLRTTVRKLRDDADDT